MWEEYTKTRRFVAYRLKVMKTVESCSKCHRALSIRGYARVKDAMKRGANNTFSPGPHKQPDTR